MAIPLKVADLGGGAGAILEFEAGDKIPISNVATATLGLLSWAEYSGSANAITLTSSFPRTSYATGDQIRFRATATNTGPATVNLDGLGAQSIVTVTGVALPAGYIRTGVETVMTYDGTRWVADRAEERVVNASGWYIRYANGKAECGNSEVINRTTSATVYGPVNRTLPLAFLNTDYLVSVENSYFGSTPSAVFFDYGIYTSKAVSSFNIAFYGRAPGQPTIPSSTGTLVFIYRAEGVWYI
jgi:hypothetical protein